MTVRHTRISLAIRSILMLAMLPVAAQAQDTSAPDPASKTLETVRVTGSHIKQTDKVTQAPVAIFDRETIEESGAASVGEFLQQITASGKALNAKFNSSGNFGYPPDGGGIGAGSAQVDLRNLGSQRVLVLVDGIRWVNESSASGVSGSADLNTIPLAIVERIEVLEDGASAIYGSDAIAGVVNIITRRTFDGALVHAKYGRYGLGGETKDFSVTLGSSGERLHTVFAASYFEQDSISSGAWEQSAFPQPGAGLSAGSSGTPQGRFIFCDPNQLSGEAGFCDPAGENWYDITLNNGTTTPVWNPDDPSSGSYHNFSGADRFNYAPFNLLLTPSRRTSIFGSLRYQASDNIEVHAKILFNRRASANQAAPEPIFVGPFAGTGGLADTVIISALNPYNPFGIDLDPATNFGFITKRPIELGPRIFTQDVDTWYFNGGVNGTFEVGENTWDWDVNVVKSSNTARQVFENGFNVRKLKLALGDPAVCAASPGCVPLDLFGGQGRPMTAAMLNYISTTQHDSSRQELGLISANLTGALWDVGEDRQAGFAVGVEHRKYHGEFNPDPLRQIGESQDSNASAVSASYDVNEVYGELHIPWAQSFSTDFAVRYSHYSSFGAATTGKAGFRWQPIEELVFRGTYSTGFRAPNLGELYGLTQFAPSIVDPCGPTGTVVVDDSDGLNTTPLETSCRAQGVPSGYQQANTQIIAFTGGNPDLDPEKSNNYNIGVVWAPSWADGLSWSDRLDFEVDYYNYRIKKGIQAPDLQALLNACVAGTASGAVCAGFTRHPSGNLNPPTAFLANLGTIKTKGLDFKANWASPVNGWGQLTAALQATHPISFEAVDVDGNRSSREVGVEVDNGSIPEWQTNMQFGWEKADWSASWNVRYISSVKEDCNSALVVGVPGCATRDELHDLGSMVYNDLQLAWNNSFGLDGMKLSAGVNNVFDRDPPICLTCTLNGYDAGTYDLPSRFWYVSLDYKF